MLALYLWLCLYALHHNTWRMIKKCWLASVDIFDLCIYIDNDEIQLKRMLKMIFVITTMKMIRCIFLQIRKQNNFSFYFCFTTLNYLSTTNWVHIILLYYAMTLSLLCFIFFLYGIGIFSLPIKIDANSVIVHWEKLFSPDNRWEL